ncbi:ABC transporter substrate-binding protein [Iamia majanohamensis]|uniref:ABC transporter substrate-binding protein n=1 Tax=Iamia majanohamensis TaxID=467976 RepID=A0AAF0BUR5_9ACTN|nr:ABC transporter substrate-binding protein [Iamia majanohamensis]WCO66025.1 ABC transporter substrate-binding protein [Iamia majanohamensis]
MTQTRRRPAPLVALAVALALLVAACGGGKGSDGDPQAAEAGDPVRGGSVTWALEAETGDGWCLPEAQLAISGIQVATTIYDTLTAPDGEGEFVPYLAEAVEPNEDSTEWTITLRDGVTFHDGSPLTAEVVKNNLDAYRGQYPARSALLYIFVLDNIDTVEVTGDLEVTVTTKVPWVAFPAFLHSSGRLGMLGQAQLDDPDSCDRELVGTGPFQLESWEKNRQFVAVRNPDYWQEAPDGESYPYLDEIRFTPVVEGEQRVNGLESGDLDLAYIGAAENFLTLDDLADDGIVKNRDSDENAEVTFLQINASKPPFDDIRIRRAMALGVDRQDLNEVINRGLFQLATGPFARGSVGYLEDSGFPSEPDVEEARRLIAEYEAEEGALPSITYQATPGKTTGEVAVYLQQAAADIGVTIDIATVQQDKLIDNAISGDYDIMGFRNYPGGDPDQLYVWFKSDSPVNFGRIQDPEIDRLLDEGRSEPDPEARREIYEEMNRRFGEQIWSIWTTDVTWRVSSAPEVFGYTVDTLPDLPDGSAPFEGLATGFPAMGLWTTEG